MCEHPLRSRATLPWLAELVHGGSDSDDLYYSLEASSRLLMFDMDRRREVVMAKRRYGKAAVGAGIVSLILAGTAVAATGDDRPSSDDSDELQMDSQEMLRDLTDEEMDALVATADPENQDGLRTFLTESAAGMTKVGPKDIHGYQQIGWVRTETMGRYENPRVREDLYEILDEDGRVIAYWGPNMLAIPASTLDAPDADEEAIIHDAVFWEYDG